jgi:hypothetical protein
MLVHALFSPKLSFILTRIFLVNMPIVAYDQISHDPQIILGKKKHKIVLVVSI